MIGSINPNMIVLARESRGWNQIELAEKIGMSATNLSKIERNDIGIQKEVLETIADKTSFPIQFFYQPGTILPENLSFRKRETVAQKLITPINAQVNIIRRHIQFLTVALNKQTPSFPSFAVTEKQTPDKIANKLRQLWNIDVYCNKQSNQDNRGSWDSY